MLPLLFLLYIVGDESDTGADVMKQKLLFFPLKCTNSLWGDSHSHTEYTCLSVPQTFIVN